MLIRLLLLLACAAPASADPLMGLKKPVLEKGGFSAHPYARFSELYNSNVLRQPDGGNVFSSWIHQVDAGFKTSLEPSAIHRLELDYGLEYQAFTHDPSANNALNHDASFLYKYRGPQGLKGGVKDRYVNTVDPPNTELTDRRRNWNNTVLVELEYEPRDGNAFFGVEGQHAAYLYTVDDPQIRELFNRAEDFFGARAGYRVLPKARAFAAYRRGIIHYSADATAPTKNSKSHSYTGGLETDLTAKISGRVEAGLHDRSYDDPGSEPRTFTMAAELSYRPLERTRLDLTARRGVEESTYAGNRYYVATGATVELRHLLPAGLAVGLVGAYQRNAYPEESVEGGVPVRREDDVYQGRLSLEYDLVQDWVKLGGSWLYRARDSRNLSSRFSYRDHVAGVTLSLVL